MRQSAMHFVEPRGSLCILCCAGGVETLAAGEFIYKEVRMLPPPLRTRLIHRNYQLLCDSAFVPCLADAVISTLAGPK